MNKDIEILYNMEEMSLDCIEKILNSGLENLPFFNEDNLPENDPTIENEPKIYECWYCGEKCSNAIELADHKMIIHDKLFGDMFICDYCGCAFESGASLEEHVFNFHPEDESDDSNNENNNKDVLETDDEELLESEQPIENNQDNNVRTVNTDTEQSPRENFTLSRISSRENNQFECPICGRMFRNQFRLGDHFTNRHANYEDQISLDKKTYSGAFAGFVVLEYIGSIFIPLSTKYEKYYKDKKCDICYEQYTLLKHTSKFQIMTSNDLDLVDNAYNEDIDIDIEFVEPSSNDETRFPLVMTCCNGEICHNCLKKHVQNLVTVKCPYCMTDHEQTDFGYITFIEIGEFDEKVWRKWWEKNNRTDLLAATTKVTKSY